MELGLREEMQVRANLLLPIGVIPHRYGTTTSERMVQIALTVGGLSG